MAESALGATAADALSGTTDPTSDFVWPTIGDSQYYTEFYEMFSILARILQGIPTSLRVLKDGDLTCAVEAGLMMDGDTERTYAGATAQALTDDDMNFVYITAAGALVINITGFPTTAHIPLATILTASGDYAHTDITDYRARALYQVAQRFKFTARVPKEWKIDGDFRNGGLAGLDNTADVTVTEAAAAYAKVYNHDDTSYENLATSGDNGAFTAHYQLYPDAEVENDAAYFGGTVPFCEIWMDMATNAVYGADSIIWEYYNGSAWSTLTILYDHTDADDQDGDRPFQQDGAVTFTPPSNWAAVTVDSQSAYWIRARCTATVNMTTVPKTNSVEHYIVSPTDGIRVPCNCRITDIRITDEAATLHTANDVLFVLHNFTKGTTSGVFTFAQDRETDSLGSQTFDCDEGDIIWPLITQEDETNEVGPATLEFDATRRQV